MRVSVELPDPPKLEPLLEHLSHQYQEVMSRLLKLQEEAQSEDRYAPILQAMQAQQNGLVQAFEHMMSMMHEGKQEDREDMHRMMQEDVMAPQQEASDALISAIRGMKRSLSNLPDELGDAMHKQFKSRQQAMKPKEHEPIPRQPNPSSAIVRKLDQMESSLLQGLKGSRSRTFGSNY